MSTNKYSLKDSFKVCWALFSRKEQRILFLFCIFNFILNIIDMLGIILVSPMVALIIDPNIMQKSEKLKYINSNILHLSHDQLIYFLMIASVTFIIIGSLGRLIGGYFINRFFVNVQNRVSEQLIESCITAPYEWHITKNPAVLAQSATIDVQQWSNKVGNQLINAVSNITLLAIAVVLVLWTSFLFGVSLMLIIGVFFAILWRPIKNNIAKYSYDYRDSKNSIAVMSDQIFYGIKDIKTTKKNAAFIGYFMKSYLKSGHASCKLQTLYAVTPTIMRLVGQMMVIIMAIFFWRVGMSTAEIAARMTLILLVASRAIPAVSVLVNSMSLIFDALPHSTMIYNTLKEIEGYIKKSCDLHSSDTETLSSKNHLKYTNLYFSNICYSYKSNEGIREALKNVSITLEQGGLYGIVGVSGSGKSTLVNLLLGLLTPSSGEYYIDGKRIDAQEVKKIQNTMAYVSQKPFILTDTVAANVAFGEMSDRIDFKKVEQVLKMVGIWDEIMSLDDGIETIMGSRGGRFSGGQCQRIAIARALYQDSKILILDEVTSSLDSINEMKIKKLIHDLHGKITIIVISHNLSLINQCNRLYLINNGILVDKGNYKELYDNNDLFRQLSDGLALVKVNEHTQSLTEV